MSDTALPMPALQMPALQMPALQMTGIVREYRQGDRRLRVLDGLELTLQPGEIVALASTLGDELITAACDLDLATMGKQTIFNFARHRRIEHYGIIASQTGVEIPPDLADAAE